VSRGTDRRTIRIAPALWLAAQDVAAKQGVTVSDLVRQALQAMVDGLPEQRGPRE
jgi:antitoxin component of RelBE/YafQ-DinJ toxin-antitoxin module